jgi:hypothetical protein
MPIVEECKKVWQQNIEQDAFLVASFERNTRSILKRCHTWIAGWCDGYESYACRGGCKN